ncbi:MAG: DUF4158 domain-containing protein [Pseudonocardiaceae bacterium]
MSARVLAEAFTPPEAEIEWARGRTQDEHHLLVLVVWLKSYQRLGYFPKVGDVPEVVVGHVRGALGLAEDVGLEQAAARSAKAASRVRPQAAGGDLRGGPRPAGRRGGDTQGGVVQGQPG